MCTLVYIAADGPLPTIPWDDTNPAFHVVELTSPEDRRVESQFRKSHIYYMGAHEKCGCGFQYGQHPLADDDPDKMERKRETMIRLAKYVSEAVTIYGSVQIFACWCGDQELPSTGHVTMKVTQLRSEPFWFSERLILTIVPDDA